MNLFTFKPLPLKQAEQVRERVCIFFFSSVVACMLACQPDLMHVTQMRSSSFVLGE